MIKNSISLEETKYYYVIDEYGDEQLLFMPVPCGKCSICRDKKANEWVSRAMAETQTSTNIPYFITLTYNNLHTPRNGVRKRALQLFMKRLRINISRLTGEECNIRFFACAEYGSKSKRSHYHALLWNIPNLDPNYNLHTDMLQDIIQKSWSFMVSKDRYDKLPSDLDTYGNPIYKYYDEDNHRFRGIYGYVKVSECNEYRVRYCMKYMRKESEIPSYVDENTGELKPCNDVFFLSSRRKGIGYYWLESKLDEYRNNPSITNVMLTDKFTGELFQGCLPLYFKNYIAPPPCRVIPKEYRDAFKEYNRLYQSIEDHLHYVNTYHDRVLEHYPTLHYYHAIKKPTMESSSIDEEIVRHKIHLCDQLEYMLLSLEYDVDILKFVPRYKHEHNKYIEQLVQNSTETISDRVARLHRNRLRRLQKEIL